MINNVQCLSFNGKVKYTAAGRKFALSQPQSSQQILAEGTKKIKKYKRVNLVVNANGYAVQVREPSGLQSYKIDEILYSIDNEVAYAVNNKTKSKEFIFDLYDFPKKYKETALRAADDRTKKNSWLKSTLMLADLIEHSSTEKIRKSIFRRFKEAILM